MQCGRSLESNMKTDKEELPPVEITREEVQGSIMTVKLYRSTWETHYTRWERFTAHLFTFLFPGVLQIYIVEDVPS